jgi:hypothetical protein
MIKDDSVTRVSNIEIQSPLLSLKEQGEEVTCLERKSYIARTQEEL